MPAGRAWLVLLGVLGASGCLHRKPPKPAYVAHPHYELGPAYQVPFTQVPGLQARVSGTAGFWYYPAEDYGLDATGIAAVQAAAPGLTADGEVRDPQALTASMQTIQLPAIVEVTDLENGRQLELRVNDRGPATPGRVIALSPRAALLLGVPAQGAARVRVRVDQALSRRLVEQLGGGPSLRIEAAPAAAVTAEALPPPGGGPAGPARSISGATAEAAAPLVADRLPERVQVTYANPGQLVLACGVFGRFTYANVVASKLSGLGADVVRSRDGRQTVYTVQAGPFATIAQADAALAQALSAGVIDARIRVR